MAAQGSTLDGPLLLRGGGLILRDINNGKLKVEERFAVVNVTAAELLALNATPKELVPAPGAGKVIEFLGGLAVIDSSATAYDGVAAGEDFAVKYENASGAVASTTLETTGLIDQTTDQVRTFKPIVTDLAPLVNKALVLHLLAGEIATGTGTMRMNVRYRIWETGL